VPGKRGILDSTCSQTYHATNWGDLTKFCVEEVKHLTSGREAPKWREASVMCIMRRAVGNKHGEAPFA
jgi:hypothetical protein